MNEHLLKYSISPRVVKVGEISKIEIKGVDESSIFYDDLDYRVEIIAEDNWNYKEGMSLGMYGRDTVHEMTCTPKDGVISFEYVFGSENLWTVKVTRLESDKHIPERYKKYWNYIIKDRVYAPVTFEIYALEEDLYGKRKPYKGDLHIHTYDSDGCESPNMVAAQYRKYGYDFISITDHYVYEPSVNAIEFFKGIDTDLKLFPGEEVHPVVDSILHMVNFNSKSSVNKIAQDYPDRVKHEVEEIARTTVAENVDKKTELAWFKWIYDNIKKTGGIAIYPHPYWNIFDAFNVNSDTSNEILKRGFCDVFEIIGGTTEKHGKMQVQLNNMMREMGYKYPIVASSDSHSAIKPGFLRFDQAWTVVFSESADKIPENILNSMSVAVDNYNPQNRNVYGDLRLVRYTWFLIENYFEMHDSLCYASGQAILRHVLMNDGQKPIISALENEIRKFDTLFFGSL